MADTTLTRFANNCAKSKGRQLHNQLREAVQTRVLQNTYPVRTKHYQYRLYCSDIVAYACVIVETHSHCQYTPSNTVCTWVP